MLAMWPMKAAKRAKEASPKSVASASEMLGTRWPPSVPSRASTARQ